MNACHVTGLSLVMSLTNCGTFTYFWILCVIWKGTEAKEIKEEDNMHSRYSLRLRYTALFGWKVEMNMSTNLRSVCSWFQLHSALLGYYGKLHNQFLVWSGLQFQKIFVYKIQHLLLRHINITCGLVIQRAGLI